MAFLKVSDINHLIPICLVIFAFDSLASRRTLDADGGADYNTFDAAINYVISNDLDTLLIIGTDKDAYTWSVSVDRNITSLVIRSTQTIPDSFPVITKSGTDYENFLSNNSIYFENLVFDNGTSSSSQVFSNGQAVGKTHKFKNCVIRNTASGKYFFYIFGTYASTTIFENCLFHNNNKIIHTNAWSVAPTISFVNCTFDANDQIFYQDVVKETNISFINCIFSVTNPVFPSSTLKSKVSYSLTPEALTGYGGNCVSSSNPQYAVNSSRSIPSHWKITSASPAAGIGSTSGTPNTDISGFSRSGGYEAGCWEIANANYTWDISSGTAGFQAGSGIWSASDNYWTTDGTNLTGWNGRGNTATFAGTDGTNYNITVSGTQDVDSISFNNSGYTISSGTLNFITPVRIRVATSKSAVVNSVISGGTGFNFIGSGALTLNGTNTFGGITTILDGGTLIAAVMANGGLPSSIGNSSNAASDFIINNGTFIYSGTGATTDRLFTIGTTGAGLGSSGSGAINFSNTGTMVLSGSSTRTIALQGTNTGSNTIAAVIGDNGGATSILKSDDGKWVLTGGNSYTGTTTINGGILQAAVLANGGTSSSIGASANTASNLIINGGTLSYSGVATSTNRLFTIGINGAEIDASGSGALNFSNTGSAAFSGSGARTIILNGTNSGSNTLASIIGNNGGATSLIKNGSGQWVLSASNTFTGAVTLNSGTLSVSTVAAGGASSNIGASSNSAANLIFNGGTLLYTGGAVSCDRLFTISTSGGTLNASGTGALNLSNSGSAVLSGSGTRTLTLTGTSTGNNIFSAVLGDNGGATSLTKTGTGTWFISGSSLYSGITSVNGGILVFSGSGSVYSNGTAAGTIQINNSGTLRLDRNNFLGIYTSTSPVSVIINAGGALSSNNSFNTLTNPVLNGGTILSNGGLSATLPSFALKGVVSVTGASISSISDAGGSYNRIMLGTNVPGGATEFDVAEVTSGNDLQVSTVLCDNINSGDMLEVISGLTKTGAGTMLLNASNTFRGPTTINSGTIAIGTSGSLYSNGTFAGTVIINNGGTLRFDKNNSFGDHLSTPAPIVTIHQGGTMLSNSYFNTINNLVLNGGTITANGGDVTWGAYALKGTVRAYGSVTSTINTGSGSNKYIRIGTNTTDGSTTFDIADNASGTDLVVAAVLTNNKGPNPYPDVASGIIKDGPGTMALFSVNTYTGSTVVSKGTLLVNGSISSPVSVSDSGVIGGNGIIGGSVSVADGGAVSPGDNGIGTLLTGDFYLDNQSILNFELGTTTISDKIVVNQGTGNFTADGILNISSQVGFSYGTYTLISCTGNLTNNTITLGTTPPGFSCNIQVVGKDVQLVVTEVNQAPTDITLSSTEVFEGKAINTTVGTLSTTDVNTAESFTYTLVTGTGSTDNASFNISGNQLRTSAVFNYATKSTYYIRVRSTDHDGLYTEKTFIINVVIPGTGLKAQYFDNNDFTNLKVNRTDANVNFNWGTGVPDAAMGTDDFSVRWIGKIRPKNTGTYTFYISCDDGVRLWVNNQLVINQWTTYTGVEYSGQINLTGGTLYDIKAEYIEYSSNASIIMSWECSGSTKVVIPQDYLYPPPTSPPTDISLSNSSVYEGRAVGTTVGTLTTTDPDGGSGYTYSLVMGTGSTDNANFIIVGNTLKTNAIFNNSTKSTYNIRIRTTDPTGFVYDEAFTITVTADPTVITIDVDGGADYISLDAALSAIQSGSNPNTIVFIGSDQDNYNWSFNVDRQIPGPLTIIGLETDPDKFTQINRSSTNCSNFFSNLDVSFENLIFSGNIKFSNGNSGRTISFTNCVIRNFNSGDYFIELSGNQSPVTNFKNCLFEGNNCTNGIFGFLYSGGTPDLNLINCTFDSNNKLFSSDEYYGRDNHNITNCIFVNNSTTLPGAYLKARTTYTLTSESTTGYGTGCIQVSDPQFVTSTRDIPSDWCIKNSSPARDTGNNTGAPGNDLGNASRNDGHVDAGCFEFVPYTWDLQTMSGIQSGDGTWGTNLYWTRDGIKLVAWPGAGNTALFAGADSTYTIAVNGVQNLENIRFTSNGYFLTGGTLAISGTAGIIVSPGKTATTGSVISGTSGLNIAGGGTLNLQSTNTYTGVTSITGGTAVTVALLANGGQNSNIGRASASAANVIINNGTLRYTGSAIDIDRLFSLGNNGCIIDASGSGPINFTGTGSLGFDGSGTRVLTLTGTGSGSLKSVISNNVSATSLVKSGSGTWNLSGTNNYTGTTTVSAGTLKITGSTTSATNVSSGATLCGTGSINAAVSMADGSNLDPGNGSSGKLSTGVLSLNNSSNLNFEIGSQSDSVAVTGNLILNGILNITAIDGFSSGSYTIFTCTGTITNNVITIGTAPQTFSYSVIVNAHSVVLQVSNQSDMLPITVKHTIGSGTSDTCLIYTSDWSIIFDEDNGGQIKFLSDQPDGAGVNQAWNTNQRNLFYVQYSGTSYSTSGNLSIIEQSPFYIVLRNSYTLSGVLFIEDYTVYGSGRIFLKVTAKNNSGSSQNQVLRFVTVRKNAGSSVRKAANSSAPLCPYLLNADATAGQFDILFCLNEFWSNATGFVNTTDQNSSFGIEANPFPLPDHAYRSWLFMIDFSRNQLNDTSLSTTNLANDYRNPDSLQYITGSSVLDQAWELHLWGHWRFDEYSGNVAHDYSGAKHDGTTDGTWVNGKKDGAVSTTFSQKVTVPNHSDFDAFYHFTVMAWIKTSSLTNTAYIIGKHDGTNGWKLTGNGAGKLRVIINGISFDGKSNVADNNWHHVAASFSYGEDSVKIYVDGKLDTVHHTSPDLVVNVNSSDLYMGANYTGLLDDIRYLRNIPGEDLIRSVYLNNYDPSRGIYTVRADNNNMMHMQIDGGVVNRFFPVFQIRNYWASAVPAAGCVKINDVSQVQNSDYFAYLQDDFNILTIGLNKTIYTNAVNIYIDDSYNNGYQMVGPVKKMYWGKQNNGQHDYFWVKNFSQSSFGDVDQKQFYLNWKISPSGNSKDGDIWLMGSSVTNPNTSVDTTTITNLIPGYDAVNGSFGTYSFNLNGNQLNSSEHTANTFSYTVKESSSVRVVLRVNERNVSNGNSFKIKTEWTIYPTGQIFKWDSIYQFSASPLCVSAGAFMDDRSYATLYTNTIKKRSAVIYSQNFQDFVYAWLTMRNSSGQQNQPFNSDTIISYHDVNRVGFVFTDQTASALWSATPIQTAVYMDFQHAEMNSSYIDSVSNSVQGIGIGGGNALVMNTGILMSVDSATPGDLNRDGFNEREGAYVIRANYNTVDFTLPANSDTCRFYPAFRITNYTAASKPDYVFLYHGVSAGDTIAMLEDYQYGAYLNQLTRELIIQIDSVFCSPVKIYISADRTLAVKMSGFWATGGIGCDTVGWSTESEHDNMGFNIFRRIKPAFYLDINTSTDSTEVVALLKHSIASKDTGWICINKKLIEGAASGVSFGRRDYKYIDKDVHHDVLYEYKLISVDYNNKTDHYGPVEAMPKARIPLYFRTFNYPNPFRRSTTIQFELPYDSRLTLDVFNLQGRLVRRLITPDQVYKCGYYRMNWDGTSGQGNLLGSGSYIYRITTSKSVKSKKMYIIR